MAVLPAAPVITFVVRGQSVSPADATRGALAAGDLRTFGGRGQVTQRVQVGAVRGSGDMVRVRARPGQDVVVLHISHGPSLMLHPETARDLMLAQSGLTRNAVAAARRARGGGPAGVLPDEVNVPAQLVWQGLEEAGAPASATRGRLGQVLLAGIEVVTGWLTQPAALLTAAVMAKKFDDQVAPGVYPLSAQAFVAPLKGSGVRLERIPSVGVKGAPLLVLVHGTFSDTQATFGKLWQLHPDKVDALFSHYANHVYGFDHLTLTASPIDNALMLARALPEGARVHLLTHSRGGLVAEVLARACAQPELDAAALVAFKDPAYQQQYQALQELSAALSGRDIRIERVVRVACPARGTLLASKRLDAYVSVLKWSLELAAIPVAPGLVDFLGEVASLRTDPALMPGLEAMMPESPLVQWLHTTQGLAALPGQLRVVAGDIQGDSISSWVKTLLADAFFWTDNDLIVQTRAMYGGTPRAPAGGHPSASFVLDRGGQVNHFNYFSNPRTAEAVCNGLLQDAPAGFQAIGPMSWAGSVSDGLRGMPRTVPCADRPVVIVLPGMFGSHLSVDGERVWLSRRILGGLGRLAYREPSTHVQPDGLMDRSYADLLRFLSKSHEVIAFSFDWRLPMAHEAQRLAQVMDQALLDRASTGQPVRLLAHSIGGLVARTVQLACPEVWQRWQAHPGSRLLMLGTPNGGTFVPMQVLSGDDPMGHALASFGMPFQDHTARQLMAEMPGFMQMQAGLLDDALGLRHSAGWQRLAEQDMALLAQVSWWHNGENQRNLYRWGVPTQGVLDQAVALRQRLDQQCTDAPAWFREHVVMVVGHARFTPASFEVTPDQGLCYLDAPDEGDGRVTLANALLPGVKTWRVDAAHDDLANTPGVFDAYLELLTQGDTQRLPALVGQRAGSAAMPLVRSRPAHQRATGLQPPLEVADVCHPAGDAPAPAQPPGGALRVTVHNGNLKFVSATVMVGHYGASTLTGTERVVDQFIGGVMSASLAAGLYPEKPGTHQMFLNRRQDPDSPLALPRPPHVVVVGLGEEGKLRSADLIHTVRQGTLAWAQRVAETPGSAVAEFELFATLIASGGVGVSAATSAMAIAQGVREANDKLEAGGWPQVGHLRLIEMYLDRATEAWGALRLLSIGAPEHYVLSPSVRSGVGALRKPLEMGYRGTGHDFISAISAIDENGEPSITYTLDTQRARSEARVQATQTRLVRELVQRASNDANRDALIGRTLFQLLVPVELEASLRGSSELLLELNDGTAAIPWELLDAPQDGRGGPTKPWAIRNKLLRKLRTVQFRGQVSDARVEDAVLVIGEPLCDPALYPPLPAARAEAQAVVDALTGPAGLGADRVHTLIAPDDNLGPDAAAVTNALLARPYRMVHIAGHGEPELLQPGQHPVMRGVVLSDGTFLGPREVEAMRVVPELVFLNCCHLAADPRQLLKGYDRASFAAGVAKQLIRIGVRCVVAAGWAVEDGAANRFATAFYQALMQGARFMDAVHAGRGAAYDANPLGNTWAAYQCYGDPEWVWQPDQRDANRVAPPVGQDYVGIASPVALTLALETLAVQSATQGAEAAMQREKIRYLEARFEADWGGMGAVAEAFGVAWAAACDTQRAMHWYGRAVAANDASASVKACEQFANLRARCAWSRVEQGQAKRVAPAELGQLLAQGRADIDAAVAMLTALVAVAPTLERESLLGSAYKRLALIEASAGQVNAQMQAIDHMAEHYRHAQNLAAQDSHPEYFYPALNLMAAELIRHAKAKGWQGFDPQLIQRVRASLEAKRRDDPDFWSVAGLPELGVYEALASRQLAMQLPHIARAFDDLHTRAGTPLLWASVADQLGFVLRHFSAGTGADAKAAHLLLATLRGYANAG